MRFIYLGIFIFILGGCKPSRVLVTDKESVPHVPWICIEDTQYIMRSTVSKIGVRRKNKAGNYDEKWWRFPDDVPCTWAKGFIYNVTRNSVEGFLINDLRPDKKLKEYFACGNLSWFVWGNSKKVELFLRDTLDMEVCGKKGIIPLYEEKGNKYLVFFPKYAGIIRYIKQYHRAKIPLLIVKVMPDGMEITDSILVPLPVHSLQKALDFISIKPGFNRNTLVLAFNALDTMIIVKNFHIEKDKAKYSSIDIVRCEPRYASLNTHLWKTPMELMQDEGEMEKALMLEGLKRTYLDDIYYEPRKKRWYRLVQIPFDKGKLPDDITEKGVSYKDLEILMWDKNFRFLGSVKLENKGIYEPVILGTSHGKLLLPSAFYNKKHKRIYYLDFR